MSGRSDSPTSISEYRAAIERLQAAREKASVESEGEVGPSDPPLADLKAALNDFKEIRKRLSPQDLFVVEYNVEVQQPSCVSFVIPQGTSWVDYFERAQDLSRTVYGRDVVYQGLLDTWIKNRDERATSLFRESVKVKLELCVTGSEGMQVGEQDVALQQRGLELPPGIHVMAGIVAFTIATGKQVTADPDGPVVRVLDGVVMSAGRLGVYHTPSFDERDWPDVRVGVAGQPSGGKSAR